MRRFAIALLLIPIALAAVAIASPAAPNAEPAPPTTPPSSDARSAPPETAPAPEPARSEIRCATALQLFAAVEDAWFRSDAERLAALVDTASVHIAVKPGAPPAAAVTRSAAAFLFHDQLRLVKTQAFQMTRVSVGKGSGAASARWIADWGGRQGVRTVEVSFVAAPSGGRWLLTEVRAKD